MLKISTEEQQPVFVGQHHHVFFPATVAGTKPHQSEQHRGVLPKIVYSCSLVHRRGAGEEIVDVETLQRHRHQTNRAHHRSAAADPIPHRETRQPSIFLRVPVEITADAGDCDRMFSKIQSGSFEARFCFQHSVPCFFRSTRFRNDHHNRAPELIVDLIEHSVESIRVGVVEEVNVRRILRCPERVGDELRPKGGAANSDGENVLKFFAVATFEFSRMDIGGEFFDQRVCVFDFGAQFSIGREWRFS